MGKILLVGLGLLGLLCILNAVIPLVWRWGFNVEGYHIPWGICILGGFCFWAYRSKN
jgi:hypothetical protein